MDLKETGKLCEKILVHYPSFAKQCLTPDGNMSRSFLEEWNRIIGFLSYEDAIERLDAWMEGDDHKKAPMAVDFKLTKPRHKDDAFHAPISHIWRIERGRLFDEEDREYVVDPTVELPFYWDENGYACQGKIQYRHIRRGAEYGKENQQTFAGAADTRLPAGS